MSTESVIIIILILLLIAVILIFCYCYRAKVRDYAQPYIPKAASLPRIQRPSTVGLLQACKLDNLGRKISWPIPQKSFSSKFPTFSQSNHNTAPVAPPRQKRSVQEAPSLHYASSNAQTTVISGPRLATITSRPLPRPPAPAATLTPPNGPLPTPPTNNAPRPPRGVTLQIGPPMGVTINGITMDHDVGPPRVPPHGLSSSA
jgi:hypothetical protein